MKTVTHFFKTYFPDTAGGLEEAIRQIGKVSIKAGYKVRVVTISENPRNEVIDGIQVISFKKTCGISTMPMSWDLVRNFQDLIDTTDIVQLHYPYPFIEILTLCHKFKKPIIITWHGSIVGKKLLTSSYMPILQKLYKRVDAIVPTSRKLAETSPELKNHWDKIVPINLWLDRNRFDGISDADIDFKKKIDSLGSYALFIGVFRHYKGVDTIADAASRTKGNIVMIGKGPKLVEITERVEKEGLTNLYVAGFQSDENLTYALKKCSVLILPSCSRGECFGQVLLEASYFHKPLISTELGTGTSVANKDGVSGFVIQPNDSKALAEKMNVFLLNEDKVKSFGEGAYNYYNTNFTEEIQGRKYLELYERLLAIYDNH